MVQTASPRSCFTTALIRAELLARYAFVHLKLQREHVTPRRVNLTERAPEQPPPQACPQTRTGRL